MKNKSFLDYIFRESHPLILFSFIFIVTLTMWFTIGLSIAYYIDMPALWNTKMINGADMSLFNRFMILVITPGLMSILFTPVVLIGRRSRRLFDKIEIFETEANSSKDRGTLESLKVDISYFQKVEKWKLDVQHYRELRRIVDIIDAKLSVLP